MSGDSVPRAPDASERPRGFANVPVSPGDVLGGVYVVERVIGAGGVGVIVSAHHLERGDRVAIKLLQRSASTSDENLARFDREGRALAKLRSPHVARVLDVGALASGEPYMVLEHLEGDDLAAVLRREAPVHVERAVGWVVQACEAVVEAHALGIIHRDLKPANLFLSTDAAGEETVKVLDFGISKLLRDAMPQDHGLTQADSVIGSPLYMSPEQMESPTQADERSDIWALGTLLFELLTGQAPFDAPTVPLLCAAICTGEPRPVQSLAPEVPTALAFAIHRCLANRPEDRFQSVADLAFAIAPFGAPATSLAAERIARVARTAGLPVSDDPWAGESSGPVSTIRARRALDAPATKPHDDGPDAPPTSRRRWSWSSAPPPAAGGSPGASVEPIEAPHALALHVLVAALAACVALYAVASYTAREPPPVAAQRGAWHVAREAGVVARLASAPPPRRLSPR